MEDRQGQRPTSMPSPSRSLAMILLARGLERRVEGSLAEVGLTIRTLGLLGHLQASPGLSFSELARRAKLRVQSLHPIIKELEATGIVEIAEGLTQGKSALIEVSDSGLSALRRAHLALAELDAEVFGTEPWREIGQGLDAVAQDFRRRKGGTAPDER